MGRVTVIISLVCTLSLVYVAAVIANRSESAGWVAAVVPGVTMGVLLVAYVAWERRNVLLARRNSDHLALQLGLKELADERYSPVDDVTGLYTRRQFERVVQLEFQRVRRNRRPVALLLVEIDNIQQFAPDTDPLLAELSALLKRTLRSIDIGGRYTNDALAVLLVETNAEQALIAAGRVQDAVAESGSRRDPGDAPAWTVAQGIADLEPQFVSYRAWLGAAEAALFAARGAGLNEIGMPNASVTVEQALAG